MAHDLTDDPTVARLDAVRGHSFQPTAEELTTIPQLYRTERVGLDATLVVLHYFCGACDWWLVELDPVEWLGFGYVNLGDPTNAEWGYVPLAELATVYVAGGATTLVGSDGVERTTLQPHRIVERDLHWTPRPWREVNASR